MSKPPNKRQGPSSGRPSRQGGPDDSARQTKKQIAISKKQARQNRIIWLCIGAVTLLVLIVLAAGLAQEYLIRPRASVARVNDVAIRANEFNDLLRYRRYNTHLQIQSLQQQLDQIDPSDQTNQFLQSFYQSQLEQLQGSLLTAADSTLDELIDDALIRQKAQEAGLVVTDEEVIQTINDDVRRAASPSAQTPITGTQELPTPTAVPQEKIDEIYQNALDNMGLSAEQFQTIVKRGLYRDKVQELLAGQVMTTGLVIHLQLVQADGQDEANNALARIQAGEDFALVAREVSTDTLATEQGGDLGWMATGQISRRYGQEVEDAAFALPVGQAQVVTAGEQFYVVKAVERDENGPLPAEVVSERKSGALAEWLTQQKESATVKIEKLLDLEQIPPDPFDTSSTTGSTSGSTQ
jgi:parvulin-like peptidyl-prolyl isomerase